MKINILIISSFILLLGCGKEENTTSKIPYAQVEIDIQTQLKNDFLNAYHHETFESGIKTGYAGVVAISNADASMIYAYDLCCPHEAPEKNKIVIKDGSPTGTCPKCNSVFNLADGSGRVISGVAENRLKSYRVMKDGYYYRIRN